jgi:Ca2+-transporting ATPase
MLWNQVRDIMILILVVAMGASAGIGDYKAMGALAAVIVINIIIGFTQEYKAEKALNALLKLDVPTARVLRNGEVDTLPAAELVPGDIVLLEEGVAIPADIRLCETVNLQVIEAILTGESTAIEKNTQQMAAKRPPLGDRLNMGYMSTVVVKGRGKGIVVTTGASTEMGKISVRLNNAKSPKTPLQKRLTKLGIILVIVAVVLCVIIVVVGFVRGNYWLDMLKVGVSLAVSVIPEGLVAVTTVTMAIGVSRMSKHNVLVRQLHAVETLGSITTICSDKTGTLTEGKMTAKKVWVSGREYRVKGRSTDPKDTSGKFKYKTKDDQTEEITRETVPTDLRFLLMGAGLCNNTSLAENDEGQTVMTGDPTEIALHIAAIKLGLGKERFIEEGFQFVNEHSFDSDRKRMSVVYKTAEKYYILAKGAPESLLKKSNKYLSGEKHKNLEKKLKKIEKQGAKMAGQGLRILAFGYKTYNLDEKTDEDFKNVENVESDLCFVGLIGLLDPPRKNVNNVIKQCRDAGIRVCMITGDHPSTAKAIAMKIGIASEESNVLTGEQIDLLYESNQLATLDPFPTVFARVSTLYPFSLLVFSSFGNKIASSTIRIGIQTPVRASDNKTRALVEL